MKPAFLSLLVASLPCSSFSEVILRNGVLLDRSLTSATESEVSATFLEKDPAGDDIILFTNGDVMHGSFGGIKNGLLWERSDIERPIRFGLPSVRQIVMRGRQTIEMEDDTSYFTLVSGDRIPGKIISLDRDSLVIKSRIVGQVSIPRNLVKSISPNPFNGQLYYSGPYTSDGWVILETDRPEPEEPAEEKEEKPDQEKADKTEKPEEPSAWIHSGASFFNLGSKPLAFPDAGMPDVGRISFRVEWKGRLYLTLALLSDFTRFVPADTEAEPGDKEAEAGPKDQDEADVPKFRQERLADRRKGKGFQAIPWTTPNDSSASNTYGSGYNLTLYSSYPSLVRNSFTEEGKPVVKQLTRKPTNISLSEQGEAEIEIRYDRLKGLILLFINGDYAAQWSDLEGAPGEGRGFGIFNKTSSARIRISEVVITSWNGMKDNANSMNHPERDVALLVNGTDRFSGDLTGIIDGVAHLTTDYLEARIPVGDLSRIVFKNSTEENVDQPTWESEPLTILYQPHGIIRLNPVSAGPGSIKGTSPFLGEIEADLSAASLLRFTDESPDLSDWFDEL